MTTDLAPEEIFAVDLAALAREIALDIYPLEQIIELHRLTDEEWQRIQENQKFKTMLNEMVTDWNSTASTKERVKLKSATGLESILEVYIRDIADPDIPLAQRVEAGKFLARLGEMDGQHIGSGGGGGIVITLNIGETTTRSKIEPRVINGEATAIPE